MDDKERQKYREHYSVLPDETLLELLKNGEAGLVQGAYELLKNEAIKRKLLNADGTKAKQEQKRWCSLDPKLKWEVYRAEKRKYVYGNFLKQVFVVVIGFWAVVNVKILLSGASITMTEEITMSLCLLIGIPFLISLLWLCYRKWQLFTGGRFASEQEVEQLLEKMERYEYISPEQFVLLKKSSRRLPFFKYEEYAQEQKKSPEKREEDRRKMEERLNSTEFDLDYLFKKKK